VPAWGVEGISEIEVVVLAEPIEMVSGVEVLGAKLPGSCAIAVIPKKDAVMECVPEPSNEVSKTATEFEFNDTAPMFVESSRNATVPEIPFGVSMVPFGEVTVAVNRMVWPAVAEGEDAMSAVEVGYVSAMIWNGKLKVPDR
jgi:hypothetical protein